MVVEDGGGGRMVVERVEGEREGSGQRVDQLQ